MNSYLKSCRQYGNIRRTYYRFTYQHLSCHIIYKVYAKFKSDQHDGVLVFNCEPFRSIWVHHGCFTAYPSGAYECITAVLLLTLPEHMSASRLFCCVPVAKPFGCFCVIFCRQLFFILTFFLLAIVLSIPLLSTSSDYPLVFSNIS